MWNLVERTLCMTIKLQLLVLLTQNQVELHLASVNASFLSISYLKANCLFRHGMLRNRYAHGCWFSK
ncbi:hypothetical protein VNO77_15775 [Canavalia gladiata]|uniref:Uncharacterized protein n=1 Tax=Canavalia gladiata TaxID=3824 RepID=A0AAN9QRD8_CANGL